MVKPIILSEKNPREDFIASFKKIASNHDADQVWNDFIVMSACLISNSADEKNLKRRKRRYIKTSKKYTAPEQTLLAEMFAYIELALKKNPEQDFLGSIYMELNLADLSNGQVFTPYKVSLQVAEYVFDQDFKKDIKENGYSILQDNGCGSGSALIAEINKMRKQSEEYRKYIMVQAYDCDEICALLCYIQVSLLGAPGIIVAGSFHDEEEKERHTWYTPVLCGKYWQKKLTKQS